MILILVNFAKVWIVCFAKYVAVNILQRNNRWDNIGPWGFDLITSPLNHKGDALWENILCKHEWLSNLIISFPLRDADAPSTRRHARPHASLSRIGIAHRPRRDGGHNAISDS